MVKLGAAVLAGKNQSNVMRMTQSTYFMLLMKFIALVRKGKGNKLVNKSES